MFLNSDCRFPEFHSANFNGEKSGKNSRCIRVNNGGSFNAGCYEVECDGNQVIIMVNGTEYKCTSDGAEIAVGDLKLICPN